MTISPQRCAILALHWQVNVIKPEGFFGPMLSEPVARSGVVARAARFHGAARAAGVPVVFTSDAVHAASLANLDLTTAGCLTAEEVHALLR